MAVAKLAALLLLSTGCNAVFGIERTELPPPDALPTTCPALGTTPRFSGTFHQIAVQDCDDYSPSLGADIAMAGCLGQIYGGPIGAPLTKLAIAPVGNFINLKSPRVMPEGNVAYIDNQNFDNNNGDLFEEYDSADGVTWNRIGDSGIPHGSDVGAWIGTLTRAPARHVMWANGRDGTLHELVQQGATWSEVPTLAALGVSEFYDPANLTPDGLHLVLRARTATGFAIYYAARASIDDAFGAASLLVGVPEVVDDPVMTEDCTRVYFPGVGRIFYVEQI